VSSASPSDAAVRLGMRVKRSITRFVTAGESRASPSATILIAPRSCSGGSSFEDEAARADAKGFVDVLVEIRSSSRSRRSRSTPSVAAAYGVLVLVFQHGIGKGLLGFSSTAGIAPVVPVLLFVILFGLSMDYHVFIVSRIREAYDRGESMDDAISHGIKSTAGVVTSAALVMVGVFRGVLLPAAMKLLGDHNWYLPRWLEWLPRIEVGNEASAAPEPPPVVAAS
jgi:uncharacterized membrane protein YdfJ with MMPL/SSD domain